MVAGVGAVINVPADAEPVKRSQPGAGAVRESPGSDQDAGKGLGEGSGEPLGAGPSVDRGRGEAAGADRLA